MQNLKNILVITLIIVSSCSPKIRTSLNNSYTPLDFREDVQVLGLQEPVPESSEELGIVKIGDNGFSVNCGYDVAINNAKMEARKAGGNAIKIIKHISPNLMSTCHRITAKILRVENLEDLIAAEEQESLFDGDYAILNVYRYGGYGALVGYDLYLGDSVICRVKNNYKESLKIHKDGLNTLWARTEAKAEVPINLKFGKKYYLRCGMSMGVFIGRPKLELVDKETGKAEYSSIKNKTKNR